jgi:hypothetical protein
MREVGISRASSGLNTRMDFFSIYLTEFGIAYYICFVQFECVVCEALEEVADSNNILIFTEVADSNIETICRS